MGGDEDLRAGAAVGVIEGVETAEAVGDGAGDARVGAERRGARGGWDEECAAGGAIERIREFAKTASAAEEETA